MTQYNLVFCRVCFFFLIFRSLYFSFLSWRISELFVRCSGVSFVLLHTGWQTMLLHERTILNHQSPCFHFHLFSYSYVYVWCIFSLVFNLLTGKTERKTLFFSLFRNIFSLACDDNSDYVVLMPPQLLVLIKKLGECLLIIIRLFFFPGQQIKQ